MAAKVSSDRKLELIRMIRMQNQSNRNECREREQFLYGYPRNYDYPEELHSTEMSLAIQNTEAKKEMIAKESFFLTGFRFRFILAAAIMILFIYMDKSEVMFFGMTAEELGICITKSISVEETLNSFDL